MSDGVFAIALTILVFSLEVPAGLERGQLGGALIDSIPMLIAFLISVGVISLFWFSHRELFSEIDRVDSPMMWLNMGYLGIVVMIPFVQRVQGDYPFEPLSFVMYGTLLTGLNFVDLMMRHYAYTGELLRCNWSIGRYRIEMICGIVITVVWLLSVPLSFFLVTWTVLIWVLSVPAERILRHYLEGRQSSSRDPAYRRDA